MCKKSTQNEQGKQYPLHKPRKYGNALLRFGQDVYNRSKEVEGGQRIFVAIKPARYHAVSTSLNAIIFLVVINPQSQ